MADRSVRPLRHLVHAVTGGQPPSEAQVRQAAWMRGASVAEARRHCTVTMCRHWPKRYKSRSLPPGQWYSTPIKPRTGCGLCDTD